MSKQHQQTKGIANRNQVAIEQNTIVDDSLLPSAEELAKLQQIDASIISWIMQRTEKEQDARLEFNRQNMGLVYKNLGITRTALWFAFILAIVILGAGAFFIFLEKEIAGTILSGAGVFVIIQSFLKFGRK